MQTNDLVIVRGGGDLATGVIQKFYRSGFKLLVLEIEKPTAIRRNVALCEAVYTGYAKVEDVPCKKISSLDELDSCYQNGDVPIIIDHQGESIFKLKPKAVIDAILAKRNLGTHMDMAPITIGLGPGFCAGKDVHSVIETMRGHNLGRLILNGSAIPNSGIPGEIDGKSTERVIHSPISGRIKHIHQIGDIVEAGEIIFTISDTDRTELNRNSCTPVSAPFKGILRGLIREGFDVHKGMKIADIDPRTGVDWNTISDKARCLGGAALEAYFYLS